MFLLELPDTVHLEFATKLTSHDFDLYFGKPVEVKRLGYIRVPYIVDPDLIPYNHVCCEKYLYFVLVESFDNHYVLGNGTLNSRDLVRVKKNELQAVICGDLVVDALYDPSQIHFFKLTLEEP